MLFPLPLTPFEYYYWSDDRPEYPTTFPIDLSFAGRLDQGAFLTALGQAHQRHPLLGALIDGDNSKPHWVLSGQPAPSVDWAVHSVPISHPDGEYIDLRSHVGLRVWVRTSASATRVLLQFHHACCDGLAAIRFIEDLLLFYGAAVSGDPEAHQPIELDVERLRERGTLDPGSPVKPSLAIIVRDIWITALVWSDIVFHRSAVLAVPAQRMTGEPAGNANSPSPRGSLCEHDLPRPFLEFETHVMSRDQTQKLRGVAKARGATLNDLLIRDLLIVLRDWNQMYAGQSRGRLRLSVPVSVRNPGDSYLPAANRIGFAFVSPTLGDNRDGLELLDAVHQRMGRIKQWKLALFFLGGLAFAINVGGLVPWMLRRNRSFATIVLSNLGRIFSQSTLPRREGRLVCGNVVLERMSCVPPIRPLTRASIAVTEYAGETTISLRCDPRLFRRDECRALLDAYVRRLQETACRGT